MGANWRLRLKSTYDYFTTYALCGRHFSRKLIRKSIPRKRHASYASKATSVTTKSMTSISIAYIRLRNALRNSRGHQRPP